MFDYKPYCRKWKEENHTCIKCQMGDLSDGSFNEFSEQPWEVVRAVKLRKGKCLAQSHTASNFQIEFWFLCNAHSFHSTELSYLKIFMYNKTHSGRKAFQEQHIRGPLDQLSMYCQNHFSYISERQSANFDLNPSRQKGHHSFTTVWHVKKPWLLWV